MDSVEQVMKGLSDSCRMWLMTLTDEPIPTKEAREHVYGPDWHSHENWPRLCHDTDELIRAGLIVQTLPLKHSQSWLLPAGLEVRARLLSCSGATDHA